MNGEVEPIPDHIRHGLDILFVGYNPSLRSGETGHHYANPSNRFWKLLYLSGLTSRIYAPEEDYTLLELGYGFTNIVARPTKAADEIRPEEYVEGRQLLKEKIALFQPRIVCFVGKGVFEQYCGKRNTKWGKQQESVIPDVIDFVAPSSSGLVRMKMEEITPIFRRLADLLLGPSWR
jgi:double-stranded uracil-DNA glycosylase